MAAVQRVVVERDVACVLRDGTVLRTDIYRPDGLGPYPALLERTPYNKSGFMRPTPPIDILRAAQAGFVVAVQDTRGRFASDGVFTPFAQEQADGADAVEWLAHQPGVSGRVALFGSSYAGATQWLAAGQGPPSLRAISPVRSAAAYGDGWTYQGGAFQLGFIMLWALAGLGPNVLRRELARGAGGVPEFAELARAIERVESEYGRVPLYAGTFRRLAESCMPYLAEWITHPPTDNYWRATSVEARFEQVQVPSLIVGGWFDIFLQGTLRSYVEMKRRGGSALARHGTRLVIGPWGHANMIPDVGELSFGLQAHTEVIDFTGLSLGWMRQLLVEEVAAASAERPVRLFVMGANVWRDEDEWPLARARVRPYYLHSGGRANTARGDGVLSVDAPSEERPDHFLYDPWDPVPTRGGGTLQAGHATYRALGPKDQSAVEQRGDVLVYTSAVLERDLEVTGPVALRLYASTSGRDTDWTAKLVDVYPDGRAMLLTDGILRARYRHSIAEAALVEPGRVEEYLVDLVATSNVFLAGHRVRLEISSSNFPRFDRNPTSGAEPAFAGLEEFQPALQSVFHERAYPSALLLPIVE
jgi:putative CocE/NonD family hydrolase